MFSLSLVDTLRLAFGQVVYHHKSHTEAAAACARWSRWFRAVEAVLMLGVLISALATAFARGQAFAFTGAVLAGAAMLVFLLHMVFDFEASSRAHHLSGARLWHLREQYRSLLADLRDGSIDQDRARTKRDALMDEASSVFESAPSLTRSVFSGSAGSEEASLADEVIDRFLPKSLQHPPLEPLAVSEGEAR